MRMILTPKVIDKIVNNDLCIGCGLCVYKCPSNALEMKWNEYGFITPDLIGKCDTKGDCLVVCPFNPFPHEEVRTENELANIYLTEALNYRKEIGKYTSIYAGYSEEFRLTSSSGGIATYIFAELLETGIVDHIFSVKESTIPGEHYVYSVSSNKEELLSASKTKYFPVTLGTIFPMIHELKGKIAIVGVACFIKAIRLAQHSEPDLKGKIPFLVGIICGGVKSRFFTEYLASKAGVSAKNIQKPNFRVKDLNAPALDYSFSCYDESCSSTKTIKMRSIGDMWGTGFFKANACDFCDDVASELADISLGDAWISPFNNDGHGTNVIVTRSSVAEELIHKGIKNGKLYIEQLPIERFLASQQGGFTHRQTGLPIRLNQAKKQITAIPPKRFEDGKVSIIFKITQMLRMKIRQKSLDTWRNSPTALSLDKKMKPLLFCLRMVTRMRHYNIKISTRLTNLFNSI